MIFANSVPEAEQRGQESEGAGEGHVLARELGRGRCWYNVRGGTVRSLEKKAVSKKVTYLGKRMGQELGLMREKEELEAVVSQPLPTFPPTSLSPLHKSPFDQLSAGGRGNLISPRMNTLPRMPSLSCSTGSIDGSTSKPYLISLP